MKTRDFVQWLSTMKSSVSTWTYYTDFKKVYGNVDKIKIELNILNSLIASKNIEEDFVAIVKEYPNVLKTIPILLAKRELEIQIEDVDASYLFDFNKMSYSIDQYVLFMRNSGLFDLLENHIINNLVDYVLGIEVGLDSNARKNRSGHIMEDLVESYLVKAGLKKNVTYFKEMCISEVERKFHLDLSNISNKGKTEKRFNFVFIGAFGDIYACECNFYSSSGSKLNETARSYKTLALEAKSINKFHFVWFTDGIGWNDAKNNLKETFDILDNIYNLNDLNSGAIDDLVDNARYLKHSL